MKGNAGGAVIPGAGVGVFFDRCGVDFVGGLGIGFSAGRFRRRLAYRSACWVGVSSAAVATVESSEADGKVSKGLVFNLNTSCLSLS